MPGCHAKAPELRGPEPQTKPQPYAPSPNPSTLIKILQPSRKPIAVQWLSVRDRLVVAVGREAWRRWGSRLVSAVRTSRQVQGLAWAEGSAFSWG